MTRARLEPTCSTLYFDCLVVGHSKYNVEGYKFKSSLGHSISHFHLAVFPLDTVVYASLRFLAVISSGLSHTILEEYHCKDSEVEYGVSLKGGKKAGLFRNLGKTKNIQVTVN